MDELVLEVLEDDVDVVAVVDVDVDVLLDVLVDVEVELEVDVDVEVDVVVVSQPLQVLSHWPLKLAQKPSIKISWHCDKDRVLFLFAHRWSVLLVDVDVDVELMLVDDVDELDDVVVLLLPLHVRDCSPAGFLYTLNP